MPPKKTTAPAKPAAKGTATKTTAAKPGASKGGATKGATGGTKAPAKAEPKKEEKPAVVKKVINPTDVPLKQIAGVLGYAGDVGEAYKASGRWLFIIDRIGNAATFLKYRDVNYVQVGGPVELSNETLRSSLMGSLRFGKPNLLDIGGCDQAQILDLVKNKYDELKKGTYDSILDRSIFEEEKRMALVRTTDTEEYHDRYSYRTDDFQFIVLTDDDPPSSVMENFFPINIV